MTETDLNFNPIRQLQNPFLNLTFQYSGKTPNSG